MVPWVRKRKLELLKELCFLRRYAVEYGSGLGKLSKKLVSGLC